MLPLSTARKGVSNSPEHGRPLSHCRGSWRRARPSTFRPGFCLPPRQTRGPGRMQPLWGLIFLLPFPLTLLPPLPITPSLLSFTLPSSQPTQPAFHWSARGKCSEQGNKQVHQWTGGTCPPAHSSPLPSPWKPWGMDREAHSVDGWDMPTCSLQPFAISVETMGDGQRGSFGGRVGHAHLLTPALCHLRGNRGGWTVAQESCDSVLGLL